MGYKILTAMSVIAGGAFTVGVLVGMYLVTPPQVVRLEVQEDLIAKLNTALVATRQSEVFSSLLDVHSSIAYLEQIENREYEAAAENLKLHYLVNLGCSLEHLEKAIRLHPEAAVKTNANDILEKGRRLFQEHDLGPKFSIACS